MFNIKLDSTLIVSLHTLHMSVYERVCAYTVYVCVQFSIYLFK